MGRRKKSRSVEREITEDQFIEWFKPEADRDGNYFVQRDHPRDSRLIEKANREHRLWTVVEGDAKLIITSGYHYVNMLYFIITKVPVDPNVEYYIELD